MQTSLACIPNIVMEEYNMLDPSCGFQLTSVDVRTCVLLDKEMTRHRLVQNRTDAGWSCCDDIDGSFKGLGSISIQPDDALQC